MYLLAGSGFMFRNKHYPLSKKTVNENTIFKKNTLKIIPLTFCVTFRINPVTLPTGPCISESCIKTKTNLNFYFDTSLWYIGEHWSLVG